MIEEPKVPAWVTDGWYGNNPGSQKLAIQRFRQPVVSRKELDAVAAFNRRGERLLRASLTHKCAKCGRFAFPKPQTICFWCRS